MHFKGIALSICLLGASLPLFANMQRADQLFEERNQGDAKALEARNAYASLVSSATGSDKVYVVTQMGRLDIFRAVMLENVPQAKAKPILEGCIAMVEQIKGINMTDAKKGIQSQEYYYIKTACLAFRAKLAEDSSERLQFGLQIRKIKDEVIKATSGSDGKPVGGFEGGGCLRVLAGVYSNPKAQILNFFIPRQAEEYATKALDTREMANRPFSTMAGRDYFENYYYQAFANLGIAIKEADQAYLKKGIEILDQGIEDIDFLIETGDLGVNRREGETLYYHRVMKAVKNDVKSCLANNETWLDCLIDKIEKY